MTYFLQIFEAFCPNMEVVPTVLVKRGIHDSFNCLFTARLRESAGHKPPAVDYLTRASGFAHNNLSSTNTIIAQHQPKCATSIYNLLYSLLQTPLAIPSHQTTGCASFFSSLQPCRFQSERCWSGSLSSQQPCTKAPVWAQPSIAQ
jgi:hypothetical protein